MEVLRRELTIKTDTLRQLLVNQDLQQRIKTRSSSRLHTQAAALARRAIDAVDGLPLPQDAGIFQRNGNAGQMRH
jgi:hypothetical protein